MSWVDVIICLITQVLNKNSQPTWVDIVAGELRNQLLYCPEGDWGGGTGDLLQRLRMAGIATSHIHCSCPLMVGEVFFFLRVCCQPILAQINIQL